MALQLNEMVNKMGVHWHPTCRLKLMTVMSRNNGMKYHLQRCRSYKNWWKMGIYFVIPGGNLDFKWWKFTQMWVVHHGYVVISFIHHCHIIYLQTMAITILYRSSSSRIAWCLWKIALAYFIECMLGTWRELWLSEDQEPYGLIWHPSNTIRFMVCIIENWMWWMWMLDFQRLFAPSSHEEHLCRN